METERSVESQRLKIAVVSGKSMAPLLQDGDKVVLDTQISSAELKVGQIVAVGKSLSHMALHRLIAINENQVITKGDNTVFSDKPFGLNHLHGLAVTCLDQREGLFELFPHRIGIVKRFIRGYFTGMLLYPRFRLSRLPKLVLTNIGFIQKLQSIRINMRYETQKLGNDTVIYDHKTGDLHSLNETAAFIWTNLQSGKTVPEVVDLMIKTYEGLTTEAALADTEILIQDLKSKDLLSE